MISFISSLEVINVVLHEAKSKGCKAKSQRQRPDPNIFLWIAAFVTEASAVNPNVIKTVLANSLSTFLIKGNPIFNNGPKSLPRKSPDYPILYNWFFDYFILADELFAKTLRNFETCVLVNKNLWGKLFSSLESPTTFDEIFRVTSVPSFIRDFNLSSCELDNFTFKVLYWVILYW